MRAVIQAGVRELRVADIDEPSSEATAKVRTRAVGICGSDLHLYRARTEPQSRPGGHEVAGELIGLPAAYDGPLAVGDLVAADTICLGRSCGGCEYCLAGAPLHCRRPAGPLQRGGLLRCSNANLKGCSSCQQG